MSFVLQTLVAFLPIASAAHPVQDPNADAKFRTLAETLKSPDVKPDDRSKAIAAALEGVKIEKLSASQVEVLARAEAVPFLEGDVREKLVARLKVLSAASNVEGATAAMLRPLFVAGPTGQKMTQEIYNQIQSERRTMVTEAAKHPALLEAIRAGHGAEFLSTALSVRNADLSKDGLYKNLASALSDALPGAFARPALALAELASSEKSGFDKDTATKLRATALALVDKAASDPATDTRTKKWLVDQKKQLTGAAARGELLGHPAPPIAFTWSNAKKAPKSFADFKGKVVVVDFWATWCGPCIAAFPHLRELQERYKDSPVVILGVTSVQGFIINPKAKDPKERRVETPKPEDELARMPEWLKEMEVTWTVAFSEDSCFNPEFGVKGIPHIAIIDAKGIVRHNGIHPSDKTLEDKIDALVKETGASVPPRKGGAGDSKH